MTSSDLVSVLLGVLALGVTAGMVLVLVRLCSVLGELRATLDIVRAELVPAVQELRGSVHDARGEVERVGRLLDQSEIVADRVDAASKIAYSAFSKPVIKAMAVRAGTTEAVRKLRSRP